MRPHGCSLPESSVHEISQSRTLEWVVISYSRESSLPRDWTHISCIGRSHQVSPRRNIYNTLKSTYGIWPRLKFQLKKKSLCQFISIAMLTMKQRTKANKKIHRNENYNHETRKWHPHSKKGCVPLKNGRVESADPFRMEVSGTHNQTKLWLTTKMNWSLGYSQGCVIYYWNFKNCYTDLYINHLWVYLIWVEAFHCPNHFLIYKWIFLWTLAKTLKSHILHTNAMWWMFFDASSSHFISKEKLQGHKPLSTSTCVLSTQTLFASP